MFKLLHLSFRRESSFELRTPALTPLPATPASSARSRALSAFPASIGQLPCVPRKSADGVVMEMGSGASGAAADAVPPTPSPSGDGSATPPPASEPPPLERMAISPPRAGSFELDCYPYGFSPLLLFAPGSYFDKGYSNYNAVAQFFGPVVEANMCENVLYERKNLLYEELYDFIIANKTLVTCCIDAHFTAFQVLPDKSLVYYDPMRPTLSHVGGDAAKKFALFLLLKCHYGNSQHIQDNADHYTGAGTNATRRLIYALWRDVNKVSGDAMAQVRSRPAPLNLDAYLFVNGSGDARCMSTQLTGNTCYFQTYLFAILAKVGGLSLGRGGLDVARPEQLAETTQRMCRYLLEFFAEAPSKTLRPLTNSNVVLDFHRYEHAPYYGAVTRYLRSRGVGAPAYGDQYAFLLRYFTTTKVLHGYDAFTLSGAMHSTANTKELMTVLGSDDAVPKLARSHFYKYRAANLMFGFNTAILHRLRSFPAFNALRKNQLLGFYEKLAPLVGDVLKAAPSTKYRDYYFLPQYEVGQRELVDVHHYCYALDLFALLHAAGDRNARGDLASRVQAVNQLLSESVLFSTQRQSDYDKILSRKDFAKSRKYYDFYLSTFFSLDFLNEFAGLGFTEINPKEKDVNSLTQTVFYSTKLMTRQAHRMEYEFEKECVNQMARSTLRKYATVFDGNVDLAQTYKAAIKIGFGITYTMYNTLLHFLTVARNYWRNPDLSSLQLFGKDCRHVLGVLCQKICFDEGRDFYHYGPVELPTPRRDLDLAVGNPLGDVLPGVARSKRGDAHTVLLTDRVFEHGHLVRVVTSVFEAAGGEKLRTDNAVVNLVLLSLLLDFGLFDTYGDLLNLPSLTSLASGDTKALQVEVSNVIHERDKAMVDNPVTRLKVEELIFEVSSKFLVNKHLSVRSKEFELIRQLNADPASGPYVVLVKIYMSLCNINRSAEVDYYKIRCDGDYRILIPRNFSQRTSDYLDDITARYTFCDAGTGFVSYDGLKLFDVREPQPEMHLYKVRIDSGSPVQSMVKYVEIDNVFRSVDDGAEFLVFVADTALRVAVDAGRVVVRINSIAVECSTIFFNEALSFVPCFKYADGEDVILFTSPNLTYAVDTGGQFHHDYYGMKHELMECILSEEALVDANDAHVFKKMKLSELVTESKVVFHFPDYLLTVTSRQQLVNLLDFAIAVRNVSMFILVLLYLRRSSVALDYVEKDQKVVKITGPWKEAILYALDRAPKNAHYDAIFSKQFADLNAHERLPLGEFVEELCGAFCRYQRRGDGGGYEIVPTRKQKDFLARILSAEECFHFSEVGSGKTKVILPLLCMAFLSNNAAVHDLMARGGEAKHVLVVLVPEHLVPDAKAQVFRYCLNLNFRDEYRVYDDVFALLHDDVDLRPRGSSKRFAHGGSKASPRGPGKSIFITSFNQFKKALTYDAICAKVWPMRDRVLVLVDEVDDFLDRDKLVFNICSNKGNAFDRDTLARYHAASRAAYEASPDAGAGAGARNPSYWTELAAKFAAIHAEVQDASRSINKSFGIFNERTLRHCRSNVAHDVEGYKRLIARPYESVNRAMPGSYYSDVERTIYLTWYVLMEDTAKYDDLFKEERKFVSFEYFNDELADSGLDYDDLVYGTDSLSELVAKHPATKAGLTKFLYEIILRRMEIRDRSRSVNAIDVVFNFDCVGFTGTPFIDNYPTFAYIRRGREDAIPDLIDRSFYVHGADGADDATFAAKFAAFQGKNDHVVVDYAPSDFVRDAADELDVLGRILEGESTAFNALVDLCGVFKRSSVHEVRDRVRAAHKGFAYLYHIDQGDGGDRCLAIDSDNDVRFDEEFYKSLVNQHGAALPSKIFFFVDNRNVIGKEVPFQLLFHKRFGRPLFERSVVVAHDVDDFSKIWQAMGRSRTMNATTFAIYKSGLAERTGSADVKAHALSRDLYVRNCDRKIAGNLSSAYQTLVSLVNLAAERFYSTDDIVNAFLEKMAKTLDATLEAHEAKITKAVLGAALPRSILRRLLLSKFARSPRADVRADALDRATLAKLLGNVVKAKYERGASDGGGVLDGFLVFLAGEQDGFTEVSYTKQQQKQKQKQRNAAQDSDTIEAFDRDKQLVVSADCDDYFAYTRHPAKDVPRTALELPLAVPVVELAYALRDGDAARTARVYPTLQFLYSHHIMPDYITPEVRDCLAGYGGDPAAFVDAFLAKARAAPPGEMSGAFVGCKSRKHFVRQNPAYALAALEPGVYVIGMKDQFNAHDLARSPLAESVRFVMDDAGFVLHRRPGGANSLDEFGPYCVEPYVLMEALAKQEVAANVLDYYAHHRDKLDAGLAAYGEAQGAGFVCWRFLMNDAARREKK